LSIKYIKSLLWRVAERLSYTEDAWGLKVNFRLRKHLLGQIDSDFNENSSINDNGWRFRTLNADELLLFSHTGDRVSTIVQLSDSQQFTVRLADGTTRSAWGG